MLTLYNSLTRQKEEFKPIHPGKIKIYVCGVTVYDYYHLGHARTYVAFDTIIRYLRFRGYDVLHVRNVTDIDDKIIKRANERGISSEELGDIYEKEFLDEMDNLNVIRPDFITRVTEYVPQIIKFIEKHPLFNHVTRTIALHSYPAIIPPHARIRVFALVISKLSLTD